MQSWIGSGYLYRKPNRLPSSTGIRPRRLRSLPRSPPRLMFYSACRWTPLMRSYACPSVIVANCVPVVACDAVALVAGSPLAVIGSNCGS